MLRSNSSVKCASKDRNKLESPAKRCTETFAFINFTLIADQNLRLAMFSLALIDQNTAVMEIETWNFSRLNILCYHFIRCDKR